MNKKMTCYIPWVSNNMYTDNVRRLITEAGFQCCSFRDCLKHPKLFLECSVFNFNWFEKAEKYSTYLEKTILLTVLKLFGKKIIYTLHNKQPHNVSSPYSGRLMEKLCKDADAIVGLCQETYEVVDGIFPAAKEKVQIIPHPNYIYNYGGDYSNNYRSKYGFREDDFVFLFLGFISPYKNVEVLIETLSRIHDRRIKLLVAGKPCDEAYKEKLLMTAKGSDHIVFDFRYIPDEEIAAYYNTANIVVMPYQLVSSLNSGAVYLSFSLQKTVICPAIGTIKDLQDTSFVYTYSYETAEEHTEKLEKAILQVVKEFTEDPQQMKKKGEQALEYVKTVHADRRIKECYSDLYHKLTS